jgi:hypothetical protein
MNHTYRFLTPEGVVSTISSWDPTSFKYTSPQLGSILPVIGAPTEMSLKQCTVWTALREMPTMGYTKMGKITPHCVPDVNPEAFEKMKNIIETSKCVDNLWHEIENSREIKRQKTQ